MSSSNLFWQRRVVRKQIFGGSVSSLAMPLRRALKDHDRIVAFNVVSPKNARLETRDEWCKYAYVDTLFVLDEHRETKKAVLRLRRSLEEHFNRAITDAATTSTTTTTTTTINESKRYCRKRSVDDVGKRDADQQRCQQQHLVLRNARNTGSVTYVMPVDYYDENAVVAQLTVLTGRQLRRNVSRVDWPKIAEIDAIFVVDGRRTPRHDVEKLCDSVTTSFDTILRELIDETTPNTLPPSPPMPMMGPTTTTSSGSIGISNNNDNNDEDNDDDWIIVNNDDAATVAIDDKKKNDGTSAAAIITKNNNNANYSLKKIKNRLIKELYKFYTEKGVRMVVELYDVGENQDARDNFVVLPDNLGQKVELEETHYRDVIHKMNLFIDMDTLKLSV